MPDRNFTPAAIRLETHSDEVNDIITAVPAWLMRWGITLVFCILGGLILFSSLISYPDIVKTSLKINSLNSPKIVLAKQSGKITRLLVREGAAVTQGMSLAYLESNANPQDVMTLNAVLATLQADVLNYRQVLNALPVRLNLGEIQTEYQTFYQEYLQYQSTLSKGYYLSKRAYLTNEMRDVELLKKQLLKQQALQQQVLANSEKEFEAYKKLYAKKVISVSEFLQRENEYFAAKQPLEQTETALLNNTSSHSAKEKELLDLDHTISEQQAKFLQSLNQCITATREWLRTHVLQSPVTGRISFAGIIQENQNVSVGQELFIVNPGNTDFFGEIQIPQYNMGKVRIGQQTLVKMKSYPFEQYGMIRGRLTYISDVAYKDSVFIAKVNFERFEDKEPGRHITLKNGMQAEAEIITEQSSLLQRFLRNIAKMLSAR
ncbi:HlyD family secretion protein [Pedobacter sp. SYP-B3415]|uniref:HlyD family secretion protein n=1 Tax=Pedobacter sp. SYP-B3415 TaxID=2496641 RepID=UPI00101C7EEE|nr:HlyD family efflux transporter periplasmic adaptor subunit [Pedobacter sp. SYP-B3415]